MELASNGQLVSGLTTPVHKANLSDFSSLNSSASHRCAGGGGGGGTTDASPNISNRSHPLIIVNDTSVTNTKPNNAHNTAVANNNNTSNNNTKSTNSTGVSNDFNKRLLDALQMHNRLRHKKPHHNQQQQQQHQHSRSHHLQQQQQQQQRDAECDDDGGGERESMRLTPCANKLSINDSYKSHFSPHTSVRIKAIDETDSEY